MAKEWFTVKECLGLPGFPGSEPAVRERLYKYSEGKEGVRRKRVKSKAEEFHISVFLFMFIVILTTAERNRRQNPFPYRKRSLKISGR